MAADEQVSITTRLGNIRILGYLAKIVHDIIWLPEIRASLHRDTLLLLESVRRLEARVQASLAETELTAAAAREEMLGLRRHADTLLSRFAGLQSDVQALGDVPAGLRELRRSQRALEARAVREAGPGGGRERLTARIVNPAKLARFQGNFRLNLGAGQTCLEDYLNVDQRELPGIDILADIGDVPFEKGTVAEICAAHTIEHFTETDLRARLLPYWHGLLTTGGKLRIVVPDAEGMMEGYAKKTVPWDQLREVTFGKQDHDGSFHHTMFSRDSLKALLRETGFSPGEYLAMGRPNGGCLEMEIVAAKQPV